MKKIFKLLVFTIILVVLPIISVKAEENISFSQFTEKGEELNGKVFMIEGEAIGDLIERHNNCCIYLSDGDTAIKVWTTLSNGLKINKFGNSEYKGDTIKVTGTYNNQCSEHGGDMDIHATRLEVVKEDSNIGTKKSTINFGVIGALLLIPITVLVAYLVIKKIR